MYVMYADMFTIQQLVILTTEWLLAQLGKMFLKIGFALSAA